MQHIRDREERTPASKSGSTPGTHTHPHSDLEPAYSLSNSWVPLLQSRILAELVRGLGVKGSFLTGEAQQRSARMQFSICDQIVSGKAGLNAAWGGNQSRKDGQWV